MAIFRLSENVPDVYVRESRDFQLLCNLFDCLQGSLKYDIDSIRDITDTALCNERLLPFLQTKLGFFTKLQISAEDLRLILKAFPTIVKNKGSVKGITQAIQVFLKINGLDMESRVEVRNRKQNDPAGSYIVKISVKGKIPDTRILTEILRYVLPAGYGLEYAFLTGGIVTDLTTSDSVRIVFTDILENGRVKSADDSFDLTDRVDTTRIVNKEVHDEDQTSSVDVHTLDEGDD